MTDDYADVIARHRAATPKPDGAIVGPIALAWRTSTLGLRRSPSIPTAHGTGVGRALLEHAEHVALKDGHTELRLLTHELMTENRNLYTRIGYTERSERPLGDGNALIIYAKPL